MTSSVICGRSNNAVDVGAVEFGGATAAAPTLASIAPSSARRGQAVSVTLTGANLTGATAVTVSGTGVNAITVSNLVVVNDTTITATFTIQAGAAITGGNATHTVSVQTPGGTSNTVSFTVFGPTVASITPVSGRRGTTVTGDHYRHRPERRDLGNSPLRGRPDHKRSVVNAHWDFAYGEYHNLGYGWPHYEERSGQRPRAVPHPSTML